MSKFNDLLKIVGSQYLLTEQDLGINQEPVQTPQSGSAIDAAKAVAPGPNQGPDADAEQKQLTVEGKRFLIELALKALSIGPDQLSEQEKALFGEPVTAENAETVLNQIQAIVEQHS